MKKQKRSIPTGIGYIFNDNCFSQIRTRNATHCLEGQVQEVIRDHTVLYLRALNNELYHQKFTVK